MCTLILYRSPQDPLWPLLLASNRDESVDRPWLPPDRHWPQSPTIRGGLDCTAQGSWLALNDNQVGAVILNRSQTLGPLSAFTSRGHLVLRALNHSTAHSAAQDAMEHIAVTLYRPFNLIIFDREQAFWIALRDPNSSPSLFPIPDGLSLIAETDLNDTTHPRFRYYPLFLNTLPLPEQDQWNGWQTLLSNRSFKISPREALCFTDRQGFQTVGGTLIALPRPPRQPVWKFTQGQPGQVPWRSLYHP